MDGGIAEIERQQGWSCKKRMVLQKNEGPGPAEKKCPAKVKFWRMWPVAAGGQCPLPPCQCHTTFFFSRPPNQLFKVTFMYFKYYIEPCSQFNSKFKPPIFSLLYLHQILISVQC